MTTDNRIPQLITGLTLICCFTSDSVSQEAQTDGKETRSAVRVDGMTLTTETFDRDPGWQGVNNRSATQRDPITICDVISLYSRLLVLNCRKLWVIVA